MLEEGLIKAKLRRLVREIEEYMRCVNRINLSEFGIDDLDDLKEIDKLAYALELGKAINIVNYDFGKTITNEYDHTAHYNLIDDLLKELILIQNMLVNHEKLRNLITEAENLIETGKIDQIPRFIRKTLLINKQVFGDNNSFFSMLATPISKSVVNQISKKEDLSEELKCELEKALKGESWESILKEIIQILECMVDEASITQGALIANPITIEDEISPSSEKKRYKKPISRERKAISKETTITMKRPKNEINILHISDLHYGMEEDVDLEKEANERRIEALNLLYYYFEHENEDLWKPDIIVITGDLGWSGKKEQFEEAYNEMIKKLLEILDLDSTKLIISPGNHDKKKIVEERPKNTTEANKLLERSRIDKIYQKFEDFNIFCDEQEINNLNFDDKINHLMGSIEINGLRFVVLNSAWFCEGGKNDKKNIYIGTNHLTTLTNKGDLVLHTKNYDEDIVTIILMHHPYGWFADQEIEDYGEDASYYLLTRKCHVILSGHIHGASIRNPFKPFNEGAWLFKVGASYEYEPGKHYKNNCEILKVNINKREISRLKIKFRYKTREWISKEDPNNYRLNFSILANRSQVQAEEGEKKKPMRYDSITHQPTSHMIVETQLYFVSLISFIDRILQGRLSSSSVIINQAKDLNKRPQRRYFNIIISFEGRRDNIITFDFLNGKYGFRIELYMANTDIYLMSTDGKLFQQQERKLIINNREKILSFYKDLNDHIELSLGFSCELPNDIKQELALLAKNKAILKEGINLLINLFKNRADSNFAEGFRDSPELRNLFRVNIRDPNRSHITDEYFYFLDRKYYIIPNSAHMRIKVEHGEFAGYENFLTPTDSKEIKIKKLTQIIKDICEYIKNNNNFLPIFDMESLKSIFD